jgi:ribosomal protein L7/L12
VIDLARSGNVIAAIKEYRQITGASLAEAKEAVENIR